MIYFVNCINLKYKPFAMKSLILFFIVTIPYCIFAQDRVYSLEIPYSNEVLHHDLRFMHIQITPDSIVFLPTMNHNEFIEEIIKDFVCEGIARFKPALDHEFSFSYTTMIRDNHGMNWVCSNKLLAKMLSLVNQRGSSDKSNSRLDNNKARLTLEYKL